MKFEGNFVVSAPPAKVYSLLTDPNKISGAIPDTKKLEVKDPSSFYTEFTVKLGFFNGVIKMNFTYKNLIPNEQIQLIGRGSGVQSTVDLSITLHVVASDGGSKVDWVADLSVGGLVAGIGGRIMDSFAKQKIDQIVEGLKTVLAESP